MLPYYIYAPPYRRTSGGVKVLYQLCHDLINKGCEAYINIDPSLVCQKSITIYPEVTRGNPLKSQYTVRYILNDRGITTTWKDYNDGYSLRVAFSNKLRVSKNDLVLTPIIANEGIFKNNNKSRKETCCFFGRNEDKIKEWNITNKSIHISETYPSCQEDLSDIFNRSKYFYCYVSTGLVLESLLCETPVIFLPDKAFTYNILQDELGNEGMSWGLERMDEAVKTVHLARENILRLKYVIYPEQLEVFIKRTQHLQ